MLIQIFLTDHRRRGVVREVMLVVFQHFQFESIETTVGGVNKPCENLAVLQRGVHQPRIHLASVFTPQIHVVMLDHADQTVGTVGKLGVQRDQMPLVGFVFEDFGQIGHGVDLRVLVSHFLRQRQRIGIVEFRRRKPDQAFLCIDFLDPRIGLGAVEFFVDVVIGHQRHAGVFPQQIQLTGFLCAARQVAAQTASDLHVVVLGPQVLRSQFGKDGLFGEHPCADT